MDEADKSAPRQKKKRGMVQMMGILHDQVGQDNGRYGLDMAGRRGIATSKSLELSNGCEEMDPGLSNGSISFEAAAVFTL
jgi:hypothetical protein